eukprot:CAMPEP_0176188052 /NCGR_PEP_ID=MMETSP0121_2-20121125/2715_1 /TAXON_ID=160619 /ORGANISM="Kryptoperidinium foliaceum, Strain CCMP 1326" /LENGTH=63 /DNA_ID=CAMNT_0017526613 /DNA_START=30 /DNA_END=218 /DNA_ORIENTATION=+
MANAGDSRWDAGGFSSHGSVTEPVGNEGGWAAYTRHAKKKSGYVGAQGCLRQLGPRRAKAERV